MFRCDFDWGCFSICWRMCWQMLCVYFMDLIWVCCLTFGMARQPNLLHNPLPFPFAIRKKKKRHESFHFHEIGSQTDVCMWKKQKAKKKKKKRDSLVVSPSECQVTRNHQVEQCSTAHDASRGPTAYDCCDWLSTLHNAHPGGCTVSPL